jgi:hypothetical protein
MLSRSQDVMAFRSKRIRFIAWSRDSLAKHAPTSNKGQQPTRSTAKMAADREDRQILDNRVSMAREFEAQEVLFSFKEHLFAQVSSSGALGHPLSKWVLHE